MKKKVCMIGAYSVGKTSLVRRFVYSLFSEKYHTTLGVKVDQKDIEVNGELMTLVLWDIHGEDEFQRVAESYFRGSSGYLLVADGTRSSTVGTAAMLRERMRKAVGDIPFLFLLNKADLASEWDADERTLAELGGGEWTTRRTSAKTGEGVEEAFAELARRMVAT